MLFKLLFIFLSFFSHCNSHRFLPCLTNSYYYSESLPKLITVSKSREVGKVALITLLILRLPSESVQVVRPVLRKFRVPQQ